MSLGVLLMSPWWYFRLSFLGTFFLSTPGYMGQTGCYLNAQEPYMDAHSYTALISMH